MTANITFISNFEQVTAFYGILLEVYCTLDIILCWNISDTLHWIYNAILTENNFKQQKKVTESARARLSTRKIRRTGTKKLNESYIQSTPSDPNMNLQSVNAEPSTVSNDSSGANLSMLGKLSESN